VGELNADAEGWHAPGDGPSPAGAGAESLAGAGVRTGQRVVRIERDDDGGTPGRWRVTTAAGAVLRANGLVAATPAVAGLLAPVTGASAPTPEAGAPIALVSLLLDAPELDAAPRGTGMLIAPDAGATGGDGGGANAGGSGGGIGVGAKAFTHATAKWPWLADRVRAAAGPGVHVVRLSYGRLGDGGADPDVTQATHDASVLLGVDLDGRVRDHLLQRWDGALPPPTPAYRAALAEFTAAVDATPRLAVVGGWVAGTGLAAIVTQAQLVATQLEV
jgi:oxygen-dependent protoporphyrinogen oxidase